MKVFVGRYVTECWNMNNEVGEYLRTYCHFVGPDRIPGDEWMIRFATSHNLSLKRPSSLEKCRKIAASNPYLIYEFYDLLERVYTDLKLENSPGRIFNVDESAFFIVLTEILFRNNL